MRIAITGASGFIGQALVPALLAEGHEVLRLVRRSPGPDEVVWDPPTRSLDPGALRGVDAVVHLAGAGIGDRRWSRRRKSEILNSRVNGTATVARALAGLRDGPKVLLSGSAVGIYGDHGDAAVDEACPPGKDFLAYVCREWEAATAPAEQAGVRVVHLRTGVVLGRAGGALARMLPFYRLGIGGPIGNGRQVLSWISLTDELRAIQHALVDPSLRGAVNLTAPAPVSNAVFTRALAKTLGRPAKVPIPALALRLAFGEMSVTILGSQRVMPTRLLEAGFRFTHPTIEAALADALSG